METVEQEERRRTFHTLDLLRGLAALAVVGRHLNGVWLRWMPGSHLAVDLFFVLSGFVIAHAYAERLQTGLGVRQFMRIRLIRLYPLYLLGSIMGVAFAIATTLVGQPGQIGVATWGAAIALTLAFLPAPFVNHFQLYPFSSVSWSLIWELAINALYAAIARRLTDAWLVAGLIVGAGLVTLSAWRFDGLDSGSTVFNWIGGPQRVLYSFLAGIAVHRFWRNGRLDWLRLPAPVSALLLLLIFSVRPAGGAPVYDAVAVLFAFPALVLAATAEPAGWLRSVSARLGLASYAVYALHPALAKLLGAILLRTGSLNPPSHLVVETGFLMLVLGAALCADRWFDRPVRAWLSTRGRGPFRRG